MYYFINFGDLCDSGSFHLYGFPGSTTHYDKKFILLLLTSFISEIKLFLFLFLFLVLGAIYNYSIFNGYIELGPQDVFGSRSLNIFFNLINRQL